MTTQLKVLVVDDDPEGRALLERMLRSTGYDLILASHVAEALEAIDSLPVDIVISDINMPGLSGFDLLARLSESERDCEVILITGYSSVESAISALRGGAFDYLTKPVKQNALLDSIARAEEKLTQTRRRQQAMTLVQSGLEQFHQISSPDDRPGLAFQDRPYKIGPVLVDPGRHMIMVNGAAIDTTLTEFEILHYLCRNPSRVVTPQELIQSIGGAAIEPLDAKEIIQPHVSNLRRKLVAASPDADVITTVRTVGYTLKSSPAEISGGDHPTY